jgi:hypothetical protein
MGIVSPNTAPNRRFRCAGATPCVMSVGVTNTSDDEFEIKCPSTVKTEKAKTKKRLTPLGFEVTSVA